MEQIYIKACFSDWMPVTKEEAKKFCDGMISRMQSVRCLENKIKLVNKRHLKGIKYEEL